MNDKTKKLIGAIVKGLIVVILLSGPAFFLYLLGGLGMFPLYVFRVYPIMAIAIIVALILVVSGYFGKKGKLRIGAVLLVILLCCGTYIGAGVYRDSIEQIDDRDFMLSQYEPFTDDTKAVYLEEESTLKFTKEELVRLDGATALYPVYSGFVQAVYPEDVYSLYRVYDDTEDGYGKVVCTNTVNCYERLVRGETDIIFVAAPSKAQLEMAEEAGMELHMTPIGKEAFVFFVNKLNPVDEISVAEVQGIYSGEITNWKEVGGRNQSIRAFQRDENSGSQSALQRLMEGKELMEPKTEDRIEGMVGIITEVAAYRNYKNAIGFSFRYYATQMASDDSIKLLALNGVEPTKETIRDGSYPISSNFYAVTASPIGEPAPEETNENIGAFIDWILSEQGQKIIEETGYVSLQ